jgi:hypothetical protein
MNLTITIDFPDPPPRFQADAYPLPMAMQGRVLPGDQIGWNTDTGPKILDIVAVVTIDGGLLGVLRPANDLADAATANAPRSIAIYDVTAPLGCLRLTLVTPLPTGRVWTITQASIICTKRIN